MLTFFVVQNKITWTIALPFIHLTEFLKAQKTKLEEEKKQFKYAEREEKVKKIFADKTVRHGNFKGLQFPNFNSTSDSLFPMLLGSYESELNPIFDKIFLNNYSEIFVIGCAEGYYAVGLAKKFPHAKILAFDITKVALEYCKEMAVLNKVEHQIKLDYLCSPDMLSDFKFTQRGLIICDCEGYELELFQPFVINNLKNCDLIIEQHDFINPQISQHIKNVFSQTHNLTKIKSIEDEQKIKEYKYPEIVKEDYYTKKFILSEYRPCIMEWAFLESKLMCKI